MKGLLISYDVLHLLCVGLELDYRLVSWFVAQDVSPRVVSMLPQINVVQINVVLVQSIASCQIHTLVG